MNPKRGVSAKLQKKRIAQRTKGVNQNSKQARGNRDLLAKNRGGRGLEIRIHDIQCHGVGALGFVLLPVGEVEVGGAGTGAGLGCSNSSVGDMRSLNGLRRVPIRGPDGSPMIGREIGSPETD